MEQNMPVIAKKASLVRVIFYMLRKGISKGKLMADLNMMLKRGKIAGKALQNLMFHHHHAWSFSAALNHHHEKTLPSFFPSPPPGEYEFSCGNSPASYPLSLFSSHKKRSNNNNHSHFFSCAQAPKTNEEEETVSVNAAAVMKALEMLHSHSQSEAASPALPGFGKTPTVRQLRITDSPFPLQTVDENSHVDEDAEKFIMKFYNELKRQNNKSLEMSHR